MFWGESQICYMILMLPPNTQLFVPQKQTFWFSKLQVSVWNMTQIFPPLHLLFSPNSFIHFFYSLLLTVTLDFLFNNPFIKHKWGFPYFGPFCEMQTMSLLGLFKPLKHHNSSKKHSAFYTSLLTKELDLIKALLRSVVPAANEATQEITKSFQPISVPSCPKAVLLQDLSMI